MNEKPVVSAVKKSIVVRCSVESAFRIWTEQLNLWWPKSHSLSGDPNTTALIEGWVGGRVYERTSEGIEHEWGTITAWEPPHHLGHSWYLGSGPTMPSHVDVHFSSQEDGTRVDVCHRASELIEEVWLRNNARYDASWVAVLGAYLEYVKDPNRQTI